MLNHGELVLHTDQVAELSHRLAAPVKIAEFALAVKGGGVPNDMIMDVCFIRVRGDNEGVLSLRKPHGKLISDFVGQLRRDLSGFKGLANLIGDHIALLGPACKLPVLPFREQELHSISAVLGSQA